MSLRRFSEIYRPPRKLSVNSAGNTSWYFTLLASIQQNLLTTFRMLLRFFQFLSIFPLSFLHAAGALAGWFVYLLSPGHRRRMRENMTRAGYLDYLPEAVAEAGKNIFELPFIWCAPAQRVLKTAVIHDWDIAQRALNDGKGVIFLTPHLGCFEIIAQAIASRVPLTALYRPPKKNALKPLMETAREREQLHLAPANLAGVRVLLKTLRKGGAIGLLPDQVPQAGEGVWAKFFGKSAYTMTLPGKLASMSGAHLILSYAKRLPHGQGYAVHFALFDAELPEDALAQATLINNAMEKLIARCPAQYFWGYNRYKGSTDNDDAQLLEKATS